MKKFNRLLESLLLQRDAIALHRVILLISPMVVILFAILGLAVQLNRQISDQQQISINRIAYVTIRNFAQLQREHLRLYALLEHSTHDLDVQSLTEQRDLVWSRLRILENSRNAEALTPAAKNLLQSYRVQWEAVQPVLDLSSHERTAEVMHTLLTELEQTEKTINEAISISQHDFEDRIIEWSASSQRLNGLLTGASIIFIFVTLLTTYIIYQFFQVQSRIGQGLRNSEQRLRAILDTIPDAVFRLTHQGIYVDVKPPQNFTMPMASEALIGKSMTDVLPPAAIGPIMEAMHNAFATGREQLCEYQWVDEAKNVVRSLEVRILPSGFKEVQMIVRDITIDKQQEESAMQAQKLESLGVLAGGIAHDFNNLLTGMLAQASLAKLKLTKGLSAVDHIDKAILSAERAADLTRQLLAYAGKGKFQITALNLNQLICDTAKLMQTALASQTELQMELDPDLPLIEANRGQVQQVVMNLFINAVEALGEKGGIIKIVTTFQHVADVNTGQGYIVGDLSAGAYVVMQISDNGIGMDQAVLSRIFDPFFSTKPKGHGLGLSATLGIIRIHQGGLHAQSQPGRGTTFTVLLPVAETTPNNLLAPIAAVVPNQEQRQTVLIIDDEAAIREVASDILAEHGYAVTTAASGQEGIELFRRMQNQVGVVLLDMKMPGLDGRQTYQLLYQMEPKLKVILSSGYSETEINLQVDAQQEISFLPKPYSADHLTRCVERALLAA